MTLVDIRKTLVRPRCSKEAGMDENFQLGETGIVKNVSDQFESQSVVRKQQRGGVTFSLCIV